MREIKMLGGKFKYVLGIIFLLVLLVVAAEAGFYFGATKKEKILPIGLPFEAPGAAPLIDQDRLAGFEFVKKGMVKGITIGVQVEGVIKEIKGPDWFRFEKDGEIMGYKVLPEEPAMNYTLIQEGSDEGISMTWQDLRVGDRIIITYTYDNNTGEVISHSTMIFR